jgi:hypothetical protein
MGDWVIGPDVRIVVNGGATGRLTEQRDPASIAPEGFDVVSNPFDGQPLV